MALITVSQAAKRIGTDEQTIRRWIERGLLTPQIDLQLKRMASVGQLHSLPVSSTIFTSAAFIDSDELEEVAESEGWLLVASDPLQREETE